MDKYNICQPQYWASYKSKRIRRSALGSETVAFSDAFDIAYSIKFDLESMAKLKIPLTMITDSLSLFDFKTKATGTTEMRLMIDLNIFKQSYYKFEIETIAFVNSANNLAGALTKI